MAGFDWLQSNENLGAHLHLFGGVLSISVVDGGCDSTFGVDSTDLKVPIRVCSVVELLRSVSTHR